MTLTPEDLKAIKERSEKATEGPWIANCFRMLNSPYWLQAGQIKLGQPENPNRSADIGFAAQARQDIPALLTHCEELEQKNRWWQNHMGNTIPEEFRKWGCDAAKMLSQHCEEIEAENSVLSELNAKTAEENIKLEKEATKWQSRAQLSEEREAKARETIVKLEAANKDLDQDRGTLMVFRNDLTEKIREKDEQLWKARESLERSLTTIQNNWVPSSGGCSFCEGGTVNPCPMNEMYRDIQDALTSLSPSA